MTPHGRKSANGRRDVLVKIRRDSNPLIDASNLICVLLEVRRDMDPSRRYVK